MGFYSIARNANGASIIVSSKIQLDLFTLRLLCLTYYDTLFFFLPLYLGCLKPPLRDEVLTSLLNNNKPGKGIWKWRCGECIKLNNNTTSRTQKPEVIIISDSESDGGKFSNVIPVFY